MSKFSTEEIEHLTWDDTSYLLGQYLTSDGFAPCFPDPLPEASRGHLKLSIDQGWVGTGAHQRNNPTLPGSSEPSSSVLQAPRSPASTWCPVPGTWYQVPVTRYQAPGARYLEPGTSYLVPSTRCLVAGTRYLKPGTRYQVTGTRYGRDWRNV